MNFRQSQVVSIEKHYVVRRVKKSLLVVGSMTKNKTESNVYIYFIVVVCNFRLCSPSNSTIIRLKEWIVINLFDYF